MLLKRFLSSSLVALLAASSLFAQDSTPRLNELQERIERLEKAIAQLQQAAPSPSPDLAELKRQIDILTQEIESMKVEQQPPKPDTPQYGLGAAAAKVYRAEHGVSFGGYGEFLYENFASKLDDGTRTDTPSKADLLRGVLYTGYKFSDRAVFNSELEVEHGKVEGSKGEASLEFAYLDFLIRPSFNVRAGEVLIPMGIVNEQHEPTAYLGTHRPLVENVIIPSTWREIGVGAFGDIGRFSYRTFIVNSINAEGFGAEQAIREGRGEGAEAAAENLAWVGRLDFHPVEGTVVGAALFTGDSAQGARTPSGSRFHGRVTMSQLHFDSKFRGLVLRALWAGGRIGDAAAINQLHGFTGDASVGRSFGGWYGEAGYDLFSFWKHGDASLTPFIRYESFDTQRSVPEGFSRSGANRGTLLTTGLAWKPFPQTVIKADYDNFDRADDSGLDRFSLSLGYIF